MELAFPDAASFWAAVHSISKCEFQAAINVCICHGSEYTGQIDRVPLSLLLSLRPPKKTSSKHPLLVDLYTEMWFLNTKKRNFSYFFRITTLYLGRPALPWFTLQLNGGWGASHFHSSLLLLVFAVNIFRRLEP